MGHVKMSPFCAPGPTTDEKSELAAANRKIRRLEQELEVMRRAAAYFGQAQIPSKWNTLSYAISLRTAFPSR